MIVVTVVTWLLLGWTFGRAFSQGDGTIFDVPYTQSALRAGFDWQNHLYRFGVVGGAPMHDLAGSLPLVQVCSLLGISATTTANLITMFIQVCFAFLGITAAKALATIWTGGVVTPSSPQRITATWLCGFAPVLGWRLAVGHENLLFGLLPFVAGISLLLAARAGTLSRTALVVGAIATLHGVSSFGSQLLVYSVVFGGPIALAFVFGLPRPRWSRAHTAVACAVIAGVLLALPRMIGMLRYGFSDDAARSVGDSVTYSFGVAKWNDWLHSFPWTIGNEAAPGLHERNYPFGPMLCVAIGLWPKTAAKRLWWGVAVGALLAILFAANVAPVSNALLAAVKILRSFRVPARAILPAVVLLPTLALSALWSVQTATPRRQLAWLGVLAAALVIAVAHGRVAVLREIVVWLGCAALVGIVRWRPSSPRAPIALAVVVPLVAALGVAAFDERFPRPGADPIEHGPRILHDAAVASHPELAMALARVQILNGPSYDVGMGFAAQLSTLDGDFNPPRRYIELLGTLRGTPMSPLTVVFRLSNTEMFPVLQQLYNVRYVVQFGADGGASIQPLAETPGPAWFPKRIVTIDDAAAMPKALAQSPSNLHDTIQSTAWLLSRDAARTPRVPMTCEHARVRDVTTDAIGQSAHIAVETDADCVLIVATNYVSTLEAHADVGGKMLDAPAFPIDIALTGILVPAHASAVTLSPRRSIPLFTRAAQLVALVLLGIALVRRRDDTQG